MHNSEKEAIPAKYKYFFKTVQHLFQDPTMHTRMHSWPVCAYNDNQ